MCEPYIGEIKLFPFNWAPKGWSRCDGQMLPVNQNQVLFALLGTKYGGDGRQNFALPDLRGRAIMHSSSQYYVGFKGGAEGVTMECSQVGYHSHYFRCTNNPANSQNARTRYFANANDVLYSQPTSAINSLHPATIVATGGDLPHNNMQPSFVLNYCIAIEGAFPSRN